MAGICIDQLPVLDPGCPQEDGHEHAQIVSFPELPLQVQDLPGVPVCPRASAGGVPCCAP